MGESAREKLEGYTYADYLKWGNERRAELIEGIIIDMTPAPYAFPDHVPVEILPEFSVDLSTVFYSFSDD